MISSRSGRYPVRTAQFGTPESHQNQDTVLVHGRPKRGSILGQKLLIMTEFNGCDAFWWIRLQRSAITASNNHGRHGDAIFESCKQ